MTKYHYATVSLMAFVTLSRVPVPKDAYVSLDPESKTIADLLNGGYRLVFTSSDHDAAIFERAIEGFPNKVAEAMKGAAPGP